MTKLSQQVPTATWQNCSKGKVGEGKPSFTNPWGFFIRARIVIGSREKLWVFL